MDNKEQKEETLSEKSGWVNSYQIYDENDENIHWSHKQEIFEVEDVKEFIKKLKEHLNWKADSEFIDKLAGEKLI